MERFSLYFLLCLLFTLAVLCIYGNSIRRSIILNGGISVLSGLLFLILAAPDVALAEAVIGSTLSTIIYLVALKHHQIVYVIYNVETIKEEELQTLFNDIYSPDHIDVHFINNHLSLKENLSRYRFADYYIVEEDKLYIYALEQDGHRQQIYQALRSEFKDVEFCIRKDRRT